MIAVDILPGIIRFHPVNFVVTDMQAQRAALPQFTEQAPQTTLSSAGCTAFCTAAAALFNPNGNEIPPAASAREPIAVDLTSVRRLIPP
jgi:hypothetical protein